MCNLGNFSFYSYIFTELYETNSDISFFILWAAENDPHDCKFVRENVRHYGLFLTISIMWDIMDIVLNNIICSSLISWFYLNCSRGMNVSAAYDAFKHARDHNFATTCVCRVPKHLREEKVIYIVCPLRLWGLCKWGLILIFFQEWQDLFAMYFSAICVNLRLSCNWY